MPKKYSLSGAEWELQFQRNQIIPLAGVGLLNGETRALRYLPDVTGGWNRTYQMRLDRIPPSAQERTLRVHGASLAGIEGYLSCWQCRQSYRFYCT
jgi:hypothetical protein